MGVLRESLMFLLRLAREQERQIAASELTDPIKSTVPADILHLMRGLDKIFTTQIHGLVKELNSLKAMVVGWNISE